MDLISVCIITIDTLILGILNFHKNSKDVGMAQKVQKQVTHAVEH